MKTKWINWTLFLALLVLWFANQAWAQNLNSLLESTNGARINDFEDHGCLQTPGGAGSVPSGATDAGGNKAHCLTCPSSKAPDLTGPDTAGQEASAVGMPRWWVDEPYINLHVVDEPLSYKISSGQDMAIRFLYKQRFSVPATDQIPDLVAIFNGGNRLEEPYVQQMRLGAVIGGSYAGMTNASWCHSWMMNITFWDTTYEDCIAGGGGGCGTPFADGYEALLFTPEGGVDYFTKNVSGQTLNASTQLTDPTSYSQLAPLGSHTYPVVGVAPMTNGITWGDSTNGFILTYPDGSSDIFGLTAQVGILPEDTTAEALLTQRIDPEGRVTSLGYEFSNSVYRVRYLVDADGRTNTFIYLTNGVSPWQLKEIDDPFGRKITFGYISTNGWLTNITDTAGNSNSFKYASGGSGWMTSLVTPYGTTSFSNEVVMDSGYSSNYQMRAVCVEEPTGAMQLFGYYHNAGNLIESSATSPSVPGWLFDNGTNGDGVAPLFFRNSFHWDRLQTANLSSSVTSHLPGSPTTAIGDMGTSDLQKGQMQHWLLGTDGISITETLSSERDPSPDPGGTIEGQRTWDAYTNAAPQDVFTTTQIGCVAQILPDTTIQYTRYSYYPSGLVATNEQSYSLPGGGTGELTNWFRYAANGIDLTNISNSLGQYTKISYNGAHQPLTIVDALGETTSLTWDNMGDNGNVNLAGITYPNGQSVSLGYYLPLYLPYYPLTNTSDLLESVTIEPEGLTINYVNYQTNLPTVVQVTGTGAPDLWTTNTWDGLNRRTGTLFQDGSTISNIYTNLDLIAQKDRVSNWTYYGYDGLQHLLAITDALSNVTRFTWCECGSLISISNALGNVTYLNRNNQELLTNVNFPDGSSLNWQYDLPGRMTNQSDGSGKWQQYTYNNQNQAVAINNTNGQLFGAYFDAVGRPLTVTNANGVVVNNSFDLINRLTGRSWVGGSSEYFGYASNGLTAYTNQDNQWTHFGRDTASRLIALTNAVQTEFFGYNALDELTSLTDGLNHTTTWSFNQYGWLTSKINALGTNIVTYTYDSDGRVTNRWMMGTNTQYQFDAVGNLTTIIYPAFTNVYRFDAIQELTNMIDPSGTNSFTWTPTGQLSSETGPWTNTVTNTYTQGHRASLSLSQPGGSPWSQSYNYDGAWRMTGLTSPAGTFVYQYSSGANQYLVSSITLPNGASITNQYDSLSRLTGTALVNYWGHPLDGYVYGLDSLGLRTNITRQLGLTTNSVAVGYDPIAEVSSWTAKEASGTSRQNEQLGYGYDAASNLHLRTNNALVQTFAVDSLNQLSNVTRSGTLTVSGALPAPPSSVTVNGTNAQTNGDFTFAASGNSLTNGANTFTIVAENAYGAAVTNTLSVNLPVTNSFQYDANGNLTNDGTRSFYYDAENRLTNVAVAGQWQTGFVYDGLSRRRFTRDYTWQSTNWLETNETRYICDGMLVLQERNSNNIPLVTYTRGLDLSTSLAWAGGIGGMLARTDTNGTTYYHSDGNGNITALMDANANVVGRALYDPYGRTLGLWGPMASVNRYWYSSKELHPNGLYYFGFRFYEPNFGRWLNHDPSGEAGGINLYEFNDDNPVRFIDPWGLQYDPNSLNLLVGKPAPTGFNGPFTSKEGIGLVIGTGATVLAVTGVGLAVDAYGTSILAWLGLGGATAIESPKGQEALAALESPTGQEAVQAAEGPAGQEAEAAAANAARVARAAAKCDRAAQKLKNILDKNLKPGPKGDIRGAISDMVGNPIPKPGGGTWDHVQDLGNMLRGLQNGVDALQDTTDPSQIALVQQAQQAIQQIQEAIKGAGL